MEPKNKKMISILRRCLTSKFVLRSRSKELFDKLQLHIDEVNEYFDQIGAKVILNSNLGVAYVVELEELLEKDLPQLGRKSELNPLETIALIFLRKKRMDYFSGEVTEESPVVTRVEIQTFLEPYKITTNEGKFSSKIDRIIKNLCYWQILLKKGKGYEISPVCEVLLSAEALKELKESSNKYFENLKKYGDSGQLESEPKTEKEE